MRQAKSICRHVGCNNLVASPGYCDKHKRPAGQRFDDLAKAPGSRAFYGGSKWTRTARAYRQLNPLCEEHKRQGLIVKGDLVDHKVERPELEAQGLDPYAFEYLQTLCTSCHNRKLSARQSRWRYL